MGDETVKVTLFQDEWYAWFVRDGAPRSRNEEEVEVPRDTLRRWRRTHAAFSKTQDEMRAAANAHLDHDGTSSPSTTSST